MMLDVFGMMGVIPIDEDFYEVYEENQLLAGLTPMPRERWDWLASLRRERAAMLRWKPEDVADLF